MQNYLQHYDQWIKYNSLDSSLKKELSLACLDENEKRDRFYTSLSFGTAGLRGLMGAGSNRMNIYTVAQATQGFANVILSMGTAFSKKGVCICYDCRDKSRDFARQAAQVMAANGIPVRIFSDMRPTPQLSFAIRHYNAAGGLNITASHNPAQYNGYKVYWQNGAQISTSDAQQIAKQISSLDIFSGARQMDYTAAVQAGLIMELPISDDDLYIDALLQSSIDKDLVAEMAAKLSVVYTPFHGVGGKIMSSVLKRLDYKSVHFVATQMEPDGAFPTIQKPNPEEDESFLLAISQAQACNADILVATDPDADRVGIMAKNHHGEYTLLSGNQTGVLLLDYIILALTKTGKMPRKPALITTIVTTPMAKYVAKQNDIPCFETFTGFKHMAQTEGVISKKGYKYILAFEESFGYMMGNHARDKDGIVASVLLLEMACHYKKQGLTLFDAMENMYRKYGGFAERTISIVLPGEQGHDKMKEIMSLLRKTPPKSICHTKLESITDYSIGQRLWLANGYIEQVELFGSDVIEMCLEDGAKYIVRPSGTEPKIKIYILARGANREQALLRADNYAQDIMQTLEL